MADPISVSVDEYLGKRSLTAKDGMVYRAVSMPKTFDAESRSATFVMTDETVDSYGDIVRAKGGKLERFETNPICLLNHRSDLMLGQWSDVKRIVRRIEGTATIAKQGTAPHVDMAYNLMSQGILRAASIGFMPLKVERRLDDDGEPLWSYDILEWDLYECSIVSVPANPAALAKSIKDGNMLARDYLEEILDTYVKTPAGIIMSIADIEAAYKTSTGEKTAVVIEALPVVKPKTWMATNEAEVAAFVAKAVETDAVIEEHETAMKAHAGGAIVAELKISTLAFPGEDVHAQVHALIKAANEAKVNAAAPVITAEVKSTFLALAAGAQPTLDINDGAMRIVALGADDKMTAELVLPDTMPANEVGELLHDLREQTKAALAGNKTGTDDIVTVTLKADTSEVEAAVEKVEGLFAKLAKAFPIFFPKVVETIETKVEPTIVPPAPPTAEAIAAAKAKFVAARSSAAAKGLIAA